MCKENPSRFLFALFAVEVSPLMQVQSRSFVQESVMVYLRGLLSMKDKYQTIFQYQSVMAWVRSLLNDGIITQSEYNVMSLPCICWTYSTNTNCRIQSAGRRTSIS